MAGVIKSIQQVSITIASGSTSATATISAVTAANAMLLFNGFSTTSATADVTEDACRIELTNSTTVTAFSNSLVANETFVVNGTVIEFSSGVNSIQSGTVSIAALATSGTATISAVGANAFVIYLGLTDNLGTDTNTAGGLARVVLTNSTTVTATVAVAVATVGYTVGFMVVDLGSTIINSVQPFSHTDATSATSYTDTITSVTTGNSILIYGGVTCTDTMGNSQHRLSLTNATTVTLTRIGAGTTTRTISYTVVEFKGAVLNGSVQRNTVSIPSGSSNTATITSINTSLSSVNFCGQATGTAVSTGGIAFTRLSLTNSTTVTVTRAGSAATTTTTSFEVIQFAPQPPPTGWANEAIDLLPSRPPTTQIWEAESWGFFTTKAPPTGWHEWPFIDPTIPPMDQIINQPGWGFHSNKFGSGWLQQIPDEPPWQLGRDQIPENWGFVQTQFGRGWLEQVRQEPWQQGWECFVPTLSPFPRSTGTTPPPFGWASCPELAWRFYQFMVDNPDFFPFPPTPPVPGQPSGFLGIMVHFGNLLTK